MFLNKTFLIFIFYIIVFSNFSFAQNESNKKLNIGYIDFQYILKNSIPSKDLQKAMDKGRELFQSSVNKEERALKEAEKQLNLKRKSISKDEFQVLVKDFEIQVASIQRLVQTSRQKIESTFQNSQQQIAELVNEVVVQNAKTNELSLVLKSDSAIYVDEKLDLTQTILEQVNNERKQFNFELLFSDILEN